MYDPFAPNPVDQADALKWLGPVCIADVGCGPNPLPGASLLYDHQDWGNSDIILLDFYKEANLIAGDSVYCRHVLEDLRYPDTLLEVFKEFERGWLEFPHITLELARGVDQRSQWVGFAHHYWIIWVEDDTLIFCPKLAPVHFIDWGIREAKVSDYYIYDNFALRYKVLQHDIDFDARDDSYINLLKERLNA